MRYLTDKTTREDILKDYGIFNDLWHKLRVLEKIDNRRILLRVDDKNFHLSKFYLAARGDDFLTKEVEGFGFTNTVIIPGEWSNGTFCCWKRVTEDGRTGLRLDLLDADGFQNFNIVFIRLLPFALRGVEDVETDKEVNWIYNIILGMPDDAFDSLMYWALEVFEKTSVYPKKEAVITRLMSNPFFPKAYNDLPWNR